MFDIKKLVTTPSDKWEVIRDLVKKEQELISALHIVQRVVDNQGEEYKEIHEKIINEFLSNYR